MPFLTKLHSIESDINARFIWNIFQHFMKKIWDILNQLSNVETPNS